MDNIELETHPWPPFIPDDAKVLILGTFPPQQKRWSMDFYYPNRTNDFWPMMGLIFFGDSAALKIGKDFNLPQIKALLSRYGIALCDTGRRIRRLRDNASDKYLDIVESVDLDVLLGQMPHCRDIATTGEKAASIIAQKTGTIIPKMGQYVQWGDIRIWRMPSTSRAYPLPLEQKAEFYKQLFKHLNDA